jgi:hypothetical protein
MAARVRIVLLKQRRKKLDTLRILLQDGLINDENVDRLLKESSLFVGRIVHE